LRRAKKVDKGENIGVSGKREGKEARRRKQEEAEEREGREGRRKGIYLHHQPIRFETDFS